MVTKMFDIGAGGELKESQPKSLEPWICLISFLQTFFGLKPLAFQSCSFFFLRSWRLIESFHYYQLSVLSFQFPAVRPDLPQVRLKIRPWNQSNRPPCQTIRSKIRPPKPNTTTDHRQTRPPHRTIRTDHHSQSRQPDQIRSPHQTTDQHPPNRTAKPASWNGTGQVHSLWVGLRGLYRALDEPCKAYFPHTFGLKFPEFFSA